jgi:hypothetical protein
MPKKFFLMDKISREATAYFYFLYLAHSNAMGICLLSENAFYKYSLHLTKHKHDALCVQNKMTNELTYISIEPPFAKEDAHVLGVLPDGANVLSWQRLPARLEGHTAHHHGLIDY